MLPLETVWTTASILLQNVLCLLHRVVYLCAYVYIYGGVYVCDIHRTHIQWFHNYSFVCGTNVERNIDKLSRSSDFTFTSKPRITKQHNKYQSQLLVSDGCSISIMMCSFEVQWFLFVKYHPSAKPNQSYSTGWVCQTILAWFYQHVIMCLWCATTFFVNFNHNSFFKLKLIPTQAFCRKKCLGLGSITLYWHLLH